MSKTWICLFVTPIFCLGCSGQQIFTRINSRDKEYKVKLIDIAKRIYTEGLTSGTGGDISIKVPDTDRFIIKATGNCFGDLDYGKLSTLGLDGSVFENSPQPSHEANIHCALYNLNVNIGAIMHIHCPYATAWATADKKIPPVTQQSVKLLKNAGLIP